MAKIIGNAIAMPNPRPDWNQTDETKADYIKNKPTFDNKVDKIEGKTLSTNDYTNDEKAKLANIEDGAQINVQADWDQTDTTQNDYIKNKPTVVEGGVYEWGYVENETFLGAEESADGLELTIFAMSVMPEVVVSDIWVNNRLEASFGIDAFDIYAKCQTDNNGYIEWTTGLGETVSYPLTTEYQKFSSMETAVFSIRCTDIVTLSPVADPLKIGLVSLKELSYIEKELINKADVNHTHDQIGINARINNGILILSKDIN